jgi:hypothetical protein
MRKAGRQPQTEFIQITRGGVIIEPIEEPELNQPVAIERSCEGNQTVDIFVPVGIATASLRPSRARKPAMDIHPPASP